MAAGGARAAGKPRPLVAQLLLLVGRAAASPASGPRASDAYKWAGIVAQLLLLVGRAAAWPASGPRASDAYKWAGIPYAPYYGGRTTDDAVRCGIDVACADRCSDAQFFEIGCCCDPLCKINGDCCPDFDRLCPQLPDALQAGGVVSKARVLPATKGAVGYFKAQTKGTRAVGYFKAHAGIVSPSAAGAMPLASCIAADAVPTLDSPDAPGAFPRQNGYPLGDNRGACQPVSDAFGNALFCVSQNDCTAVDALSSCVEIPLQGGLESLAVLRPTLSLPASSPPRGYCVRCCCDGFVASASDNTGQLADRFGFAPAFSEGVGARSCVPSSDALHRLGALAGANRYNHPFCCDGWSSFARAFALARNRTASTTAAPPMTTAPPPTTAAAPL